MNPIRLPISGMAAAAAWWAGLLIVLLIAFLALGSRTLAAKGGQSPFEALIPSAEVIVAVRFYRPTTPPPRPMDLISVRDYDPTNSTGTKIVPYGMRTEGDRRYLVFQVWDFRGPIYDLAMYFVEDRGGSECTSHVMRAEYYAVPITRLIELMTEAGFHSVQRIDQRFFQPIIVGFKRGEA